MKFFDMKLFITFVAAALTVNMVAPFIPQIPRG